MNNCRCNHACQPKNILESAGYKFRWVKKQAIKDDVPCDVCHHTFPSGTIMWVKRNKWNRAIASIHCLDCHSIQKE